MRIAINTRLLIEGRLDGIGWFTAETVERIVTQHPEHEFYLLFDRRPSPNLRFGANAHIVVLCPPARHPILWYMFFEWSVTRALKRYHIDLFYSPESYISLRTKVPTLSVIHDINFEHTRGNLRPSHQRYMGHYAHRFAARSNRIATVSEFSKRDICSTYHVPESKVDVVYDGAHRQYRPLSPNEKLSTRNQYTSGCPYFIFVSTIIPRKNLQGLLSAFDQFKRTDTSHTKLVVAGHRAWWGEELSRVYDNLQHQSDVVFTGRISTDQLALLVGSATALVYPSFFEGFGMPILEAMNAEVPVIASNRTSMPEVAGEAALLVDPEDTAAIGAAMTRLADDASLRDSLVAKGREQRNRFGWDITADRLWQSLMKIKEEQCR